MVGDQGRGTMNHSYLCEQWVQSPRLHGEGSLPKYSLDIHFNNSLLIGGRCSVA